MTIRVSYWQQRIVAQRDEGVEAAVDIYLSGIVADQTILPVGIVEERRVVDAIPGSQYRFAVIRISQAKAWPDVRAVGFNESPIDRLETSLTSGANNGAQPSAHRRVRHIRIKTAIFVSSFVARSVVVIANADVERQLGCDFDVVLNKTGAEQIFKAGRYCLQAVEGKLRSAGKHAGDGPALSEVICVCSLVAAEVKVAANVEVKVDVQLLTAHVAAEFQVVASAHVGDSVAKLGGVIADAVIEKGGSTRLIRARIK